ncbi:NAD(P)-binding protein [Daldinia loculata]|uniref:NAD(P)-binding protein n=1 Tax=Daldinia loculata TaxID=103429 RepID=UPI0020C23200|nr:NAD(P)-binding protein [Daldinia loculata]KAI1642284.1 NAD(P)-binding protein [Daldinia loculata]
MMDQLNETYRQLQERPIDYTSKLPPKLERRYIVAGGSVRLAGGFVVLQLLARGNLPESIRIIDIRKTERNDMRSGRATEIESVQISHHPILSMLLLHLRNGLCKFQYTFPEAVNVIGTKNGLVAARRTGVDIFSSTSPGSISIRPVETFVLPWASSPRKFWHILDVGDFNAPLRGREGYFANYPASKAVSEKVVCGSNNENLRTGCVRPANGVYGHPTDNTVGDPLGRTVLPSFVHGANVPITHLQHEAALARPWIESFRQAGRPFVVTDPNPLMYSDLYNAIEILSVHPFRIIEVPPVIYAELPYKYPLLRKVLPELKGDIKHLKPGIFSICTHLIASNDEIRKPVSQGDLGYTGVLITLERMSLDILECNKEHVDDVKMRKAYTTSVSLAEQIQEL